MDGQNTERAHEEAPQRPERLFPISGLGAKSERAGFEYPDAVIIDQGDQRTIIPAHALTDVHAKRHSDGSMGVYAEAAPPWGEPGKALKLAGSHTNDEARVMHLSTLAHRNIQQSRSRRQSHQRTRRAVHLEAGKRVLNSVKKVVIAGAMVAAAAWLGPAILLTVGTAAVGYGLWKGVGAVREVRSWNAGLRETDRRWYANTPHGVGRSVERERNEGLRPETWQRDGESERWTPPKDQAKQNPGPAKGQGNTARER